MVGVFCEASCELSFACLVIWGGADPEQCGPVPEAVCGSPSGPFRRARQKCR